MKIDKIFKYISIIVIIKFLISCQSFSDEIKKYDERKRTLYLYNITNQTFEPLIHAELTNEIRNRFHFHNSLILVDNPQQAIYSVWGNIILFRRETVLYDNEFRPTHYKIDAIIEITLQKSNSIIFKDEIYDSIRYSPEELVAEKDLMARRRLYDKLSRKFVLQTEKIILDDLINSGQ